MKSIFVLSAVAATLMAVGVAKANGPCSPGNAVFCDIQGPAGPQGPAGADGKDGRDGVDGAAGADGTSGRDGRDGRILNAKRYESQMGADRAAGTLQTRTPTEGRWTGAAGISGTQYGADGISVGARYGLSDRSDIYVVIGQSFDGETTWGVGATFILGN